MDFARAFTYPFDDPEWVRKIGVTALITLIPIVGWLYAGGWLIAILRRVIEQEARPMPDQLDFGAYVIDGLKSLLIYFVYGLPMIIVYAPLVLMPLTEGQNSEAAATALMALSICCCGVGGLYLLVLIFLLPAALANFAATGQIGAAFRFSALFKLLRAAPGAYLLVFAGGLVLGMLASIGSVVLIVGALLVGAYGQAVMGHLYAQAYQESKRSLGFAG